MSQRADFEEYVTRRSPFESLELVQPRDLTADEHRSLPATWLTIAELEGTSAVTSALRTWEQALPGRFAGTVANIRDRGLDVVLGRAHLGADFAPQLVLVYAIRRNSPSLPFDACFGYLPAPSSKFPAFWHRLADGLGRFHTQVHNGFRGTFGGILPGDRLRPVAADFTPPEEPEFEYVDRNLNSLLEDKRPSLDDLVVVVREGSRGVALDVSTPDLTAWEISDLIEPCSLETWSAMDSYVMGALSSDPAYYDRFGYNQT